MSTRLLSVRPPVRDALAVLGRVVRIARIEREWSVSELADRIGVSSRTIMAIEKGAPGTAIGTVLSAADLLGMRFFPEATPAELRRTRAAGESKLALLPARVDKSKKRVTRDY